MINNNKVLTEISSYLSQYTHIYHKIKTSALSHSNFSPFLATLYLDINGNLCLNSTENYTN